MIELPSVFEKISFSFFSMKMRCGLVLEICTTVKNNRQHARMYSFRHRPTKDNYS